MYVYYMQADCKIVLFKNVSRTASVGYSLRVAHLICFFLSALSFQVCSQKHVDSLKVKKMTLKQILFTLKQLYL